MGKYQSCTHSIGATSSSNKKRKIANESEKLVVDSLLVAGMMKSLLVE